MDLACCKVRGVCQSETGRSIVFLHRKQCRALFQLVVIERTPLEDELGDVLDKALQHACLTEASLAERAQVSVSKIRDAIDYRYDLKSEELTRLARVLGLNEVGFCALAGGNYPLPEILGLPFCLFPLRMPHGIGVANAYVVADCSKQSGLLFDAGSNPAALRRVWPTRIRRIDAAFITHPETEHIGGLPEIREFFGAPAVFAPRGSRLEGVTFVGDGTRLEFSGFSVEVLATPGHAEAHNSYLVRSTSSAAGPALLLSGDLFFAGSIGGAFFCREKLKSSLRKLFERLPPETVVAPGHGPLTTVGNELRFNPFIETSRARSSS